MVATGSAIVASVIVFAVRLLISYVGSLMVGWWLFIEVEIAAASVGLVAALVGSLFLSPQKTARYLRNGAALLFGGVVAHIGALKLAAYPPSWLTSAFWGVALYGQWVLAIGIAKMLAQTSAGGD